MIIQFVRPVTCYGACCRVKISVAQPADLSRNVFPDHGGIIEFGDAVAVKDGCQCNGQHLRPVHPESRLLIFYATAEGD